MAAMTREVEIRVNAIPSPAASDSSTTTSTSTTNMPSTTHTTEAPTRITRSTSRHRRPANRLPLRTAFRDFTGTVQIHVGDDSDPARPTTTYLVHKELLTSASPFFAAALGSTFAEGLEQCVRLPEEKPDSFEWFLQWLYTGSLTTWCAGTFGSNAIIPSDVAPQSLRHLLASASPDGSPLAPLDGDLRNQHGSPKYFLLIDLYALSDRLCTTQLSNYILSTLARLSESTNSVPTPSDTWILYDSVRDNAPLRSLVLDLFAYKKTDKLLESHKDDWHPKFLRELCVKLKRPGKEALERHHLVAWRPSSWATSKACEGCREVCKPGVVAEQCRSCERTYCKGCVRRHGEVQGGWTLAHDAGGCKPWVGGALCARYHEHAEGEGCGLWS